LSKCGTRSWLVPIPPREAGLAGNIDWRAVADATLHPMQVRIIEEAASRDRLSPVQFREAGTSVSLVAYHFRALLKAGLLERAGTAPRRGATEHFYRLSRRARG
jgi:DNA-binding transcriptional ArsR family regulator